MYALVNKINLSRFFWPGLVVFLIVGFLLQCQLIFNLDVSWLMHAGERMLRGGSYAQDFFEVNPPMAIYIYLPAVLLAKKIHVNFISAALIYVYCIALLSLALCYYLLRKVQNFSATQCHVLILLLVFAFIFLPGSQFGEREHLAVMMILPYLFINLSSTRFFNAMAIPIGVLAGIGFNIKPYFLLPFFLLECYRIFSQKKLFAWVRLETVLVISIALIYGLSIFLFSQDYLTKVLPIIWNFYYLVFTDPDGGIFFPLFFYVLGIYLIYGMTRSVIPNKLIADSLCITSFGFVVLYLVQKTGWYYHLFPALILALVLLALISFEFLKFDKLRLIHKIDFSTFARVLFIFCLAIFWIVPVSLANIVISSAYAAKNSLMSRVWIQTVKNLAHDSPIYTISDLMTPTYPLVDYAQVTSASRFPCLWMPLAMELAQKKFPQQIEKIQYIQNVQQIVRTAVCEDLTKYQPNLILLQIKSPNWKYFKVKIDYLKFLSVDSRFQKIWSHYSYFGTIGNYAFYQKIKN